MNLKEYLETTEMSLFGQIEQLEQCLTATWDGDLISKSERTELVKQGYIVRIEGWNIISTAGILALIKLKRLWPKCGNQTEPDYKHGI